MKLQDLANSDKIVALAQLQADPELLKNIQAHTSKLGLYPKDSIDGIWGRLTMRAIAIFCASQHLNNPTTGLFGASFAKALLEAKPRELSLSTPLDHIRLIVAECKRQGLTDPNQVAYVLATVQHETAGTYRPIDEIGARHARYAPYYGRGYVQLTWKSNYAKYSKLLGQDFVANPDGVKEPEIAAFILVHGFKTGNFTGRRIGQYIGDGKCDFIGARRCINGTDRAALIASHAQKWLPRLSEACEVIN